MKTARRLASLLLPAILPTLAHADAGTPLMWTAMEHLVFGNAIIGLVEGLLLVWWFKTSASRTIFLMIAANYFSAWIGFLLLDISDFLPLGITIINLNTWLLFFILLAFVVTLFLEYLFVVFAFRRTSRTLKRTIAAAFSINAITYVVLFGWYYSSSYTGMTTVLRVVSPDELDLPAGYQLYYISRDGKSVIRSDLDGDNKQAVKPVDSRHSYDRLLARSNDEGEFDLLIHLNQYDEDKEKRELVLERFSSLAPDTPSGPLRHMPAIASDDEWTYSAGGWAAEGVMGHAKHGDARFHASVETPFVAWFVRSATQFENDFIVFQLGADQICAMKPQAGKVALIARGHGPIVAQSKASNTSESIFI